MTRISLNEPTAEKRRVIFAAFDPGSEFAPLTGQTWSASEFQASQNGAGEGNHSGSVTEIAGGLYYYEAAIADIDAVGVTSIRNAKADAAIRASGSPLNCIAFLIGAEDIYHADLRFERDTAQDEYTVAWLRNGVRVESGITLPLIQVVKRSDGTDLVASTAMSQIATTGLYKYDEGTNRVTQGEAAIALVSATIDGAARAWPLVIGRDA